MQPFTFRPDHLAKEMADYSRKLGKGVENLLNADKIDTGVTPKVEVYCEDKLKLYRYEAPSDVVQSRVPLTCRRVVPPSAICWQQARMSIWWIGVIRMRPTAL